jgi:uncharacterized protein YhfF
VETTGLRIGTFAEVDWDWIVDAGEGEQSVEDGKRTTSPSTHG